MHGPVGDQFLSDHLDDLGRAGTAGDLGCGVLSVATAGAVAEDPGDRPG
jgi:hypothetical protein